MSQLQREISILATSLAFALILPAPLSAQTLARPIAIGANSFRGVTTFRGTQVSVAKPLGRNTHFAVAEDNRMPRWVKWGLVGAAAGAVTFAALGRSAQHPNSVLEDAAVGAAAGFVVIGGGVAFYSWVCSPGSGSRRAGLCGR